MNIIAPSVSPRLEFFVTDSTGAAVPSLDDTDVTSAAYVLITAGVRAAAVTVTLTSSVAATAAISAQQFVTIDSARGHYAVDCPSGAALSTANSVELSIVMDDGTQLVFPVSHEIRQPTELTTATSTKIDSILEDTGTTLPGLIEGIPKVGSTHRYTQVAQTSTTTDVSIGEAT